MKEKYEAPEVQVIEMEVQSPLMEASPGDNTLSKPSGYDNDDEGGFIF